MIIESAVPRSVTAVWQSMPGSFMTGSWCYLVAGEKGGLCVVDPGIATHANLEAIESAAEAVDRPVRTIVATHFHHDHLGLARTLRARWGARIALHHREQDTMNRRVGDRRQTRDRLAAWGIPDTERHRVETALAQAPMVRIRADHLLRDGESVPGCPDLVVVSTPGHTSGHICLDLPASAVIFTGDHLLASMSTGIGMAGVFPGNPLESHLASMRRISAFDDRTALPGHGKPFRGIAERAEDVVARLAARSSRVEELLTEDPHAPVWAIASQLRWRFGFQALGGASLRSALEQTEMHIALITQRDAATRRTLFATPLRESPSTSGRESRRPPRAPGR